VVESRNIESKPEMGSANGAKEPRSVTALVGSIRLGVNVFTAPGKSMVGERPRPFGEPLGFDPITSTLIFGESDAVLVDAISGLDRQSVMVDVRISRDMSHINRRRTCSLAHDGRCLVTGYQ
jgi:hypothetical protein